MEKGILILFGTFIAVGIIHFISVKAMKIDQTKKMRYRKFFWYFYGILFIINGSMGLIKKGVFDWVFSIQILLGIVVVVLNYLGKIETKIN